MFKVENICKRFSGYIAQELNLDEDKKAVINYGIFAFTQIMLCILLVIIFGSVFNVIIESLIISFVSSILRKSSGGAHSSSAEKCAVIGTVMTVIMAVIAKEINMTFFLNLIAGFIVYICSYYIIYKLAPVDSIAKPIKSVVKRKKLRKISFITVSIYLMITLINTLLYLLTEKYLFLKYCTCIYMGIGWQVFSLTKSGHLVLGKIDDLI